MVATAMVAVGVSLAAVAVIGIGIAVIMRGSVIRRTVKGFGTGGGRDARPRGANAGPGEPAVIGIRTAMGELKAIIDAHEAGRGANGQAPGRAEPDRAKS